MKTYYLLVTELISLSTWEKYDGATLFEDEFKPFEESIDRYKFYDPTDLDEAEKRLTELNLAFERYYGVEIESDAEIKDHPAFYVIFSSQYEMVTLIDGKPTFNPRKMKSRNFQQDTNHDVFAVTEKTKIFLETATHGFEFESLIDLPKPFYQLTTIPELSFPLVYHNTSIVEPSLYQEGKYSVTSDGRVTLEQDVLLEIAKHGLTISHSFKVGEVVYPNVYSIFIASGKFVSALKEQFNFNKESIYVTPIPLQLIID